MRELARRLLLCQVATLVAGWTRVPPVPVSGWTREVQGYCWLRCVGPARSLRLTQRRSSVFPEGEGDEEERRKKSKRAGGLPGESGDGQNFRVFDVPLSEGSFAEEVARSEGQGPRASEFLASADSALSGEAKPMNPFTLMVSRLSSTETIGKFMNTAPPRVQKAMRTTVAGLLGNMQPFSEDSSAVTTSENLANLMFQLQMTGYMFKNADYRLSLRQSLSGQPQAPQGPGKQAPELPRPQASPRLPEVKGTIKLTTAEGTTIEVAADAYMAELRGEVDKLRQDLVKVANARNAREGALASDLIGYVNTLPKDEIASLTGGVQKDVLDAMESLVYGILRQFGVNEGERIKLDSSDAMAKLCLWQLVIGYNLREYEVRDQFKKQLREGNMAPESMSSIATAAGIEDEMVEAANTAGEVEKEAQQAEQEAEQEAEGEEANRSTCGDEDDSGNSKTVDKE